MTNSDVPGGAVAKMRAPGATRPGVTGDNDEDGADPSRSTPQRTPAPSAQPVPTQASDPDGSRSKKPSSGAAATPTTTTTRGGRKA